MKKAAILFFLLCSLLFSGCDKKEEAFEIYGGNMVKNNTMFTSRQDNALAYELPIVSSVEITDFEITEFHVTGTGEYNIDTNGLTGGEIYNGWYYYFVNLSVSVSMDETADFSIDSVDMRINNKLVNYTIGDMKFSNTTGRYEEQVIDDRTDLVYANGTTALYQVIPSEKEDAECMSLEIQEDCTITDFNASDYLEIKNLKVFVNDKAVSFDGNLQVHAGDIVNFSYNLSYKNDVHAWNLLKATKVISYTNASGEKCVFSDAQGFMVINYVNDGFVKEYIDNMLGNE